MKRLIRTVTASSNVSADQYMFTPTNVLELLLQIEELSGVDVLLEETPSGEQQFVIGDSTYAIVENSPAEAV